MVEGMPQVSGILYARIAELEEKEERYEARLIAAAKLCNKQQSWLTVLGPVAHLYVGAFKDDEKMSMAEKLRLQEVEMVLTAMAEGVE